jgi:hypothetical protein
MIIFRCTACTRDHYTAQQPAICAGCNLSAGSFAVIPLAEPIDEPPRDLDGEADELERAPRSAPDFSPPTPRDLDGEAEAPDVAALRPLGKPHGVCSQVNCERPASHRFTWPGHPEAASCHPHALKAVQLAEHMGFFLEAPGIDAPRPA